MPRNYAIGLDIGGTKIAAGIVSSRGDIQHVTIRPTPRTADIVPTAQTLCRELMAMVSANRISLAGIGVGTAGQVDIQQGVIRYAVATLPDWAGTAIAEPLQAATNLPIRVDNDVNTMALGEAVFGAGRGTKNGIYVTVGTGIGGAIMLNGKLWHGMRGSGGELGHLLVDAQPETARPCTCGGAGHLEAYASGPAIQAQYRFHTGQSLHLPEIVARTQADDTCADKVIRDGATILGLALSGLVNTLDPEILVIGGGVAEIGEQWWRPFEEALRRSPLPAAQGVILKKAELGPQAGMIGAGWSMLELIQ